MASSTQNTSKAAKRIFNDIKKLTKDGSVLFEFDEANYKHLEATLAGPVGTPYENQTYIVKFEFSDNYPFKSPSVGFKTPIYHPNVSESGSVCADLLNERWNPTSSVLGTYFQGSLW